jgi:tetratricopeptide (TPR) repeat protein
VLYRDGQLEDAVQAYQRAVQLSPGDIPARHNLAVVLQAQGKLADAASHYEEVLRRDARYPDAHYGLALVSKSQGDMARAVRHYREALQSVPNWPEVLIDLAWLLATTTDPAIRNPQEAIEVAERAVRATNPPSWAALDASAAALASGGRVREAADQARRALEAAVASGNDAAAGQIRERLRLYD